ncbi:exoglucanase 1 [Apiospora arundinis]
MEIGTQDSQPIFHQYHKTYGVSFVLPIPKCGIIGIDEEGTKRLIAQLEKLPKRSPAKDIRKQYESQTSCTSIEPDDGSFGQGETGAVSFNLEPFQLHDRVRTSSDDVDEAIETRRALENGHEDSMLSVVQSQPNYRSERSRVSPKPATKRCHSRSIHSAEAAHDPRASVVENVAQDSDSDSDWINTFRYRRLAKRRQQQAAASLRRIRLPRPTVRSQKSTKAPANCAKASIQNCGSNLQEQAYAKAGVNDKKIGASGIAQDSLSKSESGNTNGRSAGEDQTLQTDVHNTSSHTDPPTGTPVALPSTEDSSGSNARIYGTAPSRASPAPRRQSPTDESIRAPSRHRKHQQIEDQDPMANLGNDLLAAGDGTGKATDTRTQRSSTSSRELTDERTRSLRSAQPTKSPRAGASASSELFKGMVFALSFNSQDEARKESTESLIQRASGKILVTSFDELFEPACLGFPQKSSSSTGARSLALKPDFQAAGFTALIADSHSRKAKYMQALALGLPCLSAKWISTCVSRGKVVDWSSYVLCAGSSRVLGDAICSRHIPIYEASSNTLPETLEEKPAFLRNMRILTVLQKGSQRKHMPYFVLLQMLGATLVRAKSIEEAMAETEGSGHTAVLVA